MNGGLNQNANSGGNEKYGNPTYILKVEPMDLFRDGM